MKLKTSHCLFVANLLNYLLYLRHTLLSPLDSLSVGYFLSVVSTTASNRFSVSLMNYSISDQGCKFLVKGLSKCFTNTAEPTSQLSVSLIENDIHEEGVHHLAQLLNNSSMVYDLDLSKNPIGEGGLISLCDALSTNTTVKVLKLCSCSLVSNEENGLSLCRLLSTNTSLSYFDLSNNKLTDCM